MATLEEIDFQLYADKPHKNINIAISVLQSTHRLCYVQNMCEV